MLEQTLIAVGAGAAYLAICSLIGRALRANTAAQSTPTPVPPETI